jgi:hypothetical protein
MKDDSSLVSVRPHVINRSTAEWNSATCNFFKNFTIICVHMTI